MLDRSFRSFAAAVIALGCMFAVCLSDLSGLPAQAAQKAEAPITVQKEGRGYSWTLQTPGNAGMTQVLISVLDAGGKPVKGLKITGDVWMPAMPMPGYPLELEFYEDKPGLYAALVQYAHGGDWQIRARFKGSGDNVFQEEFDFNLKD